MTTFPHQLRRLVQQYDDAVRQVNLLWQPRPGCNFTSGDRCSDCPEVKIFERLIREQLANSK